MSCPRQPLPDDPKRVKRILADRARRARQATARATHGVPIYPIHLLPVPKL